LLTATGDKKMTDAIESLCKTLSKNLDEEIKKASEAQ